MRRALAIPLSLFLAAGLLAACGSDGDSPSSGRPSMDGRDDHMDDMGGNHRESSDVAEGARSIEVTGSSFAFDPDEIEVAAGEDVAIVLTSTDILHDFTIDELDAHVAADGGETATGGLRADEPGRYTFYCTVAGHRSAGMEGTLIVEE
jgi:cytochrome c oxidase subunit 2